MNEPINYDNVGTGPRKSPMIPWSTYYYYDSLLESVISTDMAKNFSPKCNPY